MPGDGRIRLMSECSTASDGGEAGQRRKQERQMHVLLLTKQKLELTLELLRLQTKKESGGKGCQAAHAVEKRTCDGEPGIDWNRLEEADHQSAAPTRHHCDIDSSTKKPFWLSPSPPKRGPLLSSATKTTHQPLEALTMPHEGSDTHITADGDSDSKLENFNDKPNGKDSLRRRQNLASTQQPCHNLLHSPADDSVASRSFESAEMRVEGSTPGTRTQIPPALFAIMKRKGKLHLVQDRLTAD